MFHKFPLFLRAQQKLNYKYFFTRTKHTIDYSLLPTLKEPDLEEKFVHGSGPGGQAVNKSSNCVFLRHKPSGISIKCHTSRSLEDNRKVARQMLISKLDDIINGEKSVRAQKEKIIEKKLQSREYKKQKLNKLKSEWRTRENLD